MPTEIAVPDLGSSGESATVVCWLKKPGDVVRKGEPVVEIETQKAVVEIVAPDAGILSEIKIGPGQEVSSGNVLALLLPGQPSVSDTAPLETKGAGTIPAPVNADKPGTVSSGKEFEVTPLKGMRRTIAERLQRSYREAPHISLTVMMDATDAKRDLDQLNQREKSDANPHLTFTALVIKLVGEVLRKHPRLNAHFVNEEIHEFRPVHLGIAVALEDGLVVPVIRNAEQKRITEIQLELGTLITKARGKRLQPQEITGSTFTISNLGMSGIDQFTSILNPPEVGILSVGAIKETPVVRQDQIVVRSMLNVTLSADHRAVDGALAAGFLNSFKEGLENARLDLSDA